MVDTSFDGESMMRSSRTWTVATTIAVLGLTLAACGSTDDGDGNSGGSCDSSIAFLGPQTGPYANLGLNITNGVKVALDDFKKSNPDCNVTFKAFDSQGDPEKATPLAQQIISDDQYVGVVGPTFSGESDATGPAFSQAGLVTVSASATSPALTTHGWKTFHRVLGNDDTQAPADAKYIKDTLKASKVFVVDDASDYGKGLAEGVKSALGSLVTDTDEVQQKQTDFSATVTKVVAADPDVLFYGGYYAEAGLLAKQLKTGGYDGIFMSGDGSDDPGFITAAGADAAEGAILTCPCAPAPDDFTTNYKAVNGGAEPGTYSAEGYDAAMVLLSGLAAGNTDRASLLDWVNNYDADGITKHIKFDSTGEVAEVVIYAYKVETGKIVLDQPIK
jgi:branched-chain amino acid transport system substrate-binding protein